VALTNCDINVTARSVAAADTLALLKRAFLGWLRGERDHCKMVAIPTIKDEDGKRPNREHESLVGEQSRIINRIKATLARLGIRGFNPKLKKAAERLEGLRTPEGPIATRCVIVFKASNCHLLLEQRNRVTPSTAGVMWAPTSGIAEEIS
jgi:transposase